MATSQEIDSAVGTVLKSARDLKGFAKLASRKSIMTMAQPGMYQYPMMVSDTIDKDAIAAIAKAYQLTYAANVATAYSLNPVMWLKDTKEVSDFVQKFHQNSPSYMPQNLNAAGRVLGVESATEVEDINQCITVESATISTEKYSTEDLVALSLNAWDNVEESVTKESLNDMYRPYDRTSRIMTEKLNVLKSANEALGDYTDANGNTRNAFSETINNVTGGDEFNTSTPASQSVRNTTKKEKEKYNLKTKKWEKKLDERDVTTTTNRQPIQRRFDAQVVKNPQMDALEPTMINVTILMHGKSEGTFTQDVTIGVKTMPRVIGSDLMIASMTEACMDTHKIFRFLKLTNGETKTLDFLLGISDAKKKVLEKNAKQEVKLLKQAKKRRGKRLLQRLLGNEVMPTLTIVLTQYEVQQIYNACHVDLSDFNEAVRFMNKYFLLSLAIYNTVDNTLKVLFDCDEDWAFTTLSNIKTTTNKVKDALAENQVSKIFGRS